MRRGAVNAELVPWLEEQQAGWGLGTSWELGGEAETSGESQGAIFGQLPLAGLIIVLLPVAQLNSFRKPLIILISIPLGVIGVVIGLTVLARTCRPSPGRGRRSA